MRNYLFLLAMATCAFMLGAYTDATVHGLKEIPVHKWAFMSFFLILFAVQSQTKKS
jgi:hypothetical protein